MTTSFRRSPLALAILGLLEDGPLHPYGMQQLIKQWGKDQVINVGQRASLYKMINRLGEAGLIKVRETTRDHQYPERTSYELTDAGRAASRQWMAEILSTPRNEFPEFPAALSFLPMLTPAFPVALSRQASVARIRAPRLPQCQGKVDKGEHVVHAMALLLGAASREDHGRSGCP